MVNLSKFATTVLPGNEAPIQDSDIVGFVSTTKKSWEVARQQLEVYWREAWASYIGSPEAMDELRSAALHTVGDVNTDWRHKINVGKGFEAVETIHSYLMQATFPNRNWFNASPSAPGYAELAKIVEAFTLNKLDAANFQSHYENFLRQLIIVGTSVIALPWRYETMKWKKRIKVQEPQVENWTLLDSVVSFREVEVDKVIANEPDFTVIDMFDVYLDPNEKDPNKSGFIRRITKPRADVLELSRQGVYDISPLDVMKLVSSKASDAWKVDRISQFQGVKLEVEVSYSDRIELWEYWGDVYAGGVVFRDVRVLISGDKLLCFEPNPYWSGKPFMIGTYIPTAKTAYAIGAIQPNLGLLHELNIITNQRLDNLEIAADGMWKYVDDGVINPQDVYTAPGRIIPVGDMNNLMPIEMPMNFTVTYNEATVLENKINANFGTPPLISTGEVRAGERVTAAEIQAVKDAGGNRLSGIHKHIETTTLKPLLGKLFRLMQQYVNESEVVKVTGKEPGSFEYYQLDPDTLLYDFILKPVGADHVVDKQHYIQDRVDFLSMTAQFPEMARLINYEMVLRDILQQYGFDDADKYLVSQQDQATPEDPNAAMKNDLREMGGEHLLTAAQASENASGSPMDIISQAMGQPNSQEQLAKMQSEQPQEDMLLN
jgi:hypothetical protein